jgi:hypothetical protein
MLQLKGREERWKSGVQQKINHRTINHPYPAKREVVHHMEAEASSGEGSADDDERRSTLPRHD